MQKLTAFDYGIDLLLQNQISINCFLLLTASVRHSSCTLVCRNTLEVKYECYSRTGENAQIFGIRNINSCTSLFFNTITLQTVNVKKKKPARIIELEYDGGHSSVVHASEFNSNGFEPLVGQGEEQFSVTPSQHLRRLVCA